MLRGQLALWIPKGDQMGVHDLKDLTDAKIHFIAIAQPSLAPYGQAAVEALRTSEVSTTSFSLSSCMETRLIWRNNSPDRATPMSASPRTPWFFTNRGR